MPRRPRQDHARAWHHIYSRGIARRTVVETRRDARVLLYLLACEVRRGFLEVHALVLMTTHVHLLVRSLQGRVSRALKRVFNGYVRWFNRSRKRDGSLFRGRFGSRLVSGDVGRLNVIAFIDANSVEARLAATPDVYPHGSAHLWAKGRAPRWLATWYVAEMLGVDGPQGAGAWEVYRREFAPRGNPACGRLIEARLACGSNEPDPLDDLVGAAP